MSKEKLSKEEKKLKALLAPKGALTVLEHEMRKIFAGHTSKDDIFIPLERMLALVSSFQDKHHKILDELKVYFKGNESFMTHLGPLYMHVKISGRDFRKSDKHKSFVKNKAGLIKHRLSSIRPKYETVNEKKIYFVNEIYETSQPLVFLRSSRAIGMANEAMIRDLKNKSEQFVEENYNKICCSISELRNLMK
ncbi:MAG: hypothetical protein WCL02_05835 [bacterium]